MAKKAQYKISMRCDKQLWVKFSKLAESQDLTSSQLMRKLMREEIAK